MKRRTCASCRRWATWAPGTELRITESLRAVERQLVSHYLFDDGLVREQPFDLSPLKALIGANLVDLVGCVESTFHQGWAMSLSLLKFVGQASLVDEAMLPS